METNPLLSKSTHCLHTDKVIKKTMFCRARLWKKSKLKAVITVGGGTLA